MSETEPIMGGASAEGVERAPIYSEKHQTRPMVRRIITTELMSHDCNSAIALLAFRSCIVPELN